MRFGAELPTTRTIYEMAVWPCPAGNTLGTAGGAGMPGGSHGSFPTGAVGQYVPAAMAADTTSAMSAGSAGPEPASIQRPFPGSRESKAKKA